MNDTNDYPRPLTDREKEWLFFLLPEDRIGYSAYRDKIDSMLVIGEGRFGSGNYVLGYSGDKPDFSYSSLPMFAMGQIICKECTIQLSIHELFEDKIEFSINNISGEDIPDDLNELKRISCSYWLPNKPSPFENDKLKEITLQNSQKEIVLVISPGSRTIWLYEKQTGINHIIPVTNFFNELLRGNTKIDRRKGVNVSYIFDNLNLFDDKDFIKAFLQYNKQYKKINLVETEIVKPKKKGILGKLFK